MKKISFLLSSFVLVTLLAGCSTASAPQTPSPVPNPPAPVVEPIPVAKKVENINVYKNDAFGFSLKYPTFFSVNSVPDTESNTLLTLVYPESYNIGTNLQDAKILVSASKKSSDVKNCFIGDSTSKPLIATKEIQGQTFYKEAWTDGAAGHLADEVQYSTIASGACYKILFQGYAVNLSLLNQDGQKAVAYDKAKLVGIFEQVTGSFLLN